MGYILEKPYADTQRADFIVEYNHNQGLKIEESEYELLALESNEMVEEYEVIVEDVAQIHIKAVINPNYEEQQAEIERQRIMQLQLTKADVLLALYQDKGLIPDDIKAMLKNNIPALIKFDYASSYYRGDNVVITLGTALGYTSKDLDNLFEYKTFNPEVSGTLIDSEIVEEETIKE